ncbi:MAG: hypothetical protein M3360_06485 [Actinomycetota bacterium]|nr:hypothetical protein [Actinomycetota bacterium]
MRTSWDFEQGDDIVPGRVALRRLGGGHRYEAYLAWDEKLFSLVIVKVVRPDQVDSSSVLRGLAREGRMLETPEPPRPSSQLRRGSRRTLSPFGA